MAIYERFAYNIAHTFSRRKSYPTNPQRASWANVRMGLGILGRLLWQIGVRGGYRRTFWRLAWPSLKSGEIEGLLHAAIVSHHLIEFTGDCLRGLGETSFYAPVGRGGPEIAPTPPNGSGDAPRDGPAPRKRQVARGRAHPPPDT